MEILVDQILGERYQIQSLLGRQTGRRTFLARDLQTGRSVVLKLLLFGPDFTWEDLKLFEREAEVLKSIDLPTIPQYLDCFNADTELGKGFVLVQTYIEAKSLQNWLDAGRTFSEGDLVSIATQLLTILDYLHHRQPAVIHRDIKPSNILLGDRSGNSGKFCRGLLEASRNKGEKEKKRNDNAHIGKERRPQPPAQDQIKEIVAPIHQCSADKKEGAAGQ